MRVTRATGRRIGSACLPPSWIEIEGKPEKQEGPHDCEDTLAETCRERSSAHSVLLEGVKDEDLSRGQPSDESMRFDKRNNFDRLHHSLPKCRTQNLLVEVSLAFVAGASDLREMYSM